MRSFQRESTSFFSLPSSSRLQRRSFRLSLSLSRLLSQALKFLFLSYSQIHNAARNPIALDMLSAAAVDLRIELDLRTGAAITRLQTMALQGAFPELDKKVISYGESCGSTVLFELPRSLSRCFLLLSTRRIVHFS